MRASSNARATPISATVRPPPAPDATATCLPRSASAGLGRADGNTARRECGGRSTTGSGSNVLRALTRKPGSRARPASSAAVRAARLTPSRADIAGLGYGPARVVLQRFTVAGDPRASLIAALREHALVIGEVTLTSG